MDNGPGWPSNANVGCDAGAVTTVGESVMSAEEGCAQWGGGGRRKETWGGTERESSGIWRGDKGDREEE